MEQLDLLLATVTGIVTTTIIGTVKAFEQRIDTAIVSKLGNLTPILVVVLSVVLPKLAMWIGLTGPVPDATAFVNAPVATAIAVLARELTAKLTGQKGTL